MTATADTLGNSASDAIDQFQRAAAPTLKEGKRQAEALFDDGAELIDNVSTRAGDAAARLGNSLIAYTKKNPLLALVLAVGAGALLVGAARARSRR